MNKQQSYRVRAFSLVELLVAVAILALIFALASSTIRYALTATTGGFGRMNSQFNGRAVLDYIASDISEMAAPFPGQANITGVAGNWPRLLLSPTTTASPDTSISSSLYNANAIFWQATGHSTTGGSNINFVGYFVRWAQFSGQLQPLLCRVSDPLITTPPSLVPPPYAASASGPWLTTAYLTGLSPATSPNYQGLFSERVLAIWIRAMDSYGQPISLSGSPDPANPSQNLAVNYAFDSNNGFTDSLGVIHRAPAFPASIQIAVVVIDDSIASRLPSSIVAPVAANPSLFYSEIETFIGGLPTSIRPSIRYYTRQIPILFGS